MNRPPRIALSASFLAEDRQRTLYDGRPLVFAERSMFDWLLEAGAVTCLVPPLGHRPSNLTYDDLLAPFDALVLQGGIDVSPTSYGEQPRRPEWAGDRTRDDYEIGLLRASIAANKPVLGICRGHQLLNVALGGTLHQDIETEVAGALQHRHSELYERNRHELDFVPGSLFHRTFGVQHAVVNSVHHQAIKDLAPDLIVQARSSEDDIIEAVRLPADSDGEPWVVGVQWHPEFQDPADETLLPATPLIEAMFAAIRART